MKKKQLDSHGQSTLCTFYYSSTKVADQKMASFYWHFNETWKAERKSQIRNGKWFFFSTHFDNDYGKNAWMEMKKEDMKMLSTRINFNGQYNFFLASCMLSIVTFKVTQKKYLKSKIYQTSSRVKKGSGSNPIALNFHLIPHDHLKMCA